MAPSVLLSLILGIFVIAMLRSQVKASRIMRMPFEMGFVEDLTKSSRYQLTCYVNI